MTGAGKAFRIVSPGPGRKAACTNGRGMLCLRFRQAQSARHNPAGNCTPAAHDRHAYHRRYRYTGYRRVPCPALFAEYD